MFFNNKNNALVDEKDTSRKILLVFLAGLLLCVAVAIAVFSVRQGNLSVKGYKSIMVFPVAIFFAACILLFSFAEQKKLIIAIFMGIGLYLVFINPNYNVIDETGHYNYIQYIISQGGLPTVQQNYEAFQPPLYYLVMAGLTFFIKDPIISQYTLRLINLFILLACYVVLAKTAGLLQEKNVIRTKHSLNDYLPVFFVFNIGLLYRSATVTNELFTTFFAFLTLYLLCKVVLENLPRWFWVFIAVAIVCGILSRITNVFLVVLAVCVFIYKKQYKEIFYTIALVLLLVSPWFFWNIRQYGALTGNEPHLEFVRQMLWHQEAPLGAKVLLTGLFNLPDRFFFPDEFWKIEHLVDYLNFAMKLFLWCFFLFAIVRLLFLGVRFIGKKLKFQYTIEEKRNVIEMLCACGILCVLVITFYASYDSNLDLFRGRYLYAVSGAMALLLILYTEKLSYTFKYLQTTVLGILVVFHACVASYSLQRTYYNIVLGIGSPFSS